LNAIRLKWKNANNLRIRLLAFFCDTPDTEGFSPRSLWDMKRLYEGDTTGEYYQKDNIEENNYFQDWYNEAKKLYLQSGGAVYAFQ